jgi:hypothetical protein
MTFLNHEEGCVSCYIPGVTMGGVADGFRVTSIRTPIAARIATRDWLILGNDLLRLQSVVSSCLQLLESSVYRHRDVTRFRHVLRYLLWFNDLERPLFLAGSESSSGTKLESALPVRDVLNCYQEFRALPISLNNVLVQARVTIVW